jgi:large subunit ribosomal protein L32
MPLPKYKQSRSNTRARKANWKGALETPSLVECPSCHEPKMPHRACTKCGFYKGKNVLATRTEA